MNVSTKEMIQNFPSDWVHDLSYKFENGLMTYDQVMDEMDTLLDTRLEYNPVEIRFSLHPQYTEAIGEGLAKRRHIATLNMDITQLTCIVGTLQEIIDVEGRLFAVLDGHLMTEHTKEPVFFGSFAKLYYISLESFQEVNEEYHRLEQEIEEIQSEIVLGDHDLEADLEYLLNERERLKEKVMEQEEDVY